MDNNPPSLFWTDPDNCFLINESKGKHTTTTVQKTPRCILDTLRVAARYELGHKCERNWIESFVNFRMAAEIKDTDGFHAHTYLSVWRPTPNDNMVIPMLEYADKAGSNIASSLLGQIYSHGLFGIKKDDERAAFYILRSENSTFSLGQAVYAFHLEKGLGTLIKPNPKKGLELQAKIGEKTNDPQVFHNIGCLLYNGPDVIQNIPQAIIYWEKAANLRYPYSAHNLGNLYDEGYPGIINSDTKIAIDWYTKAANEGYVLSVQLLIEEHYVNTNSPFYNLETAKKWIKRMKMSKNNKVIELTAKLLKSHATLR